MPDAPGVSEKSIARLMVRRHLRSWLHPKSILSEDLVVAMFIRTMREEPDASMSEVAALVDLEIRELVAIVLGRTPEVMQAEIDSLGLDPG